MLCHSFTRNNSFLLTSQSPPGKQEKPFNSVFRHNSSLSVYLFFNSELYPGKSKDFNNEGVISQVKRAFKSYFLSPKNNKKADTLCMKFSLTSNSNVEMCLYPLFQNQRSHFLLPPLFQRISKPSCHDHQNGTYCRLPPLSFRINFKDTPSHVFMGS